MADQPAARPGEAAAETRFLMFHVAGQLYALPGAEVSEVIRIPQVARLPHSPKSLMGLVNLRGRVLPMVDPRSLLGRGSFAPGGTARAIVTTGSTPVALAVDTVDALVALRAGQVETRQAELSAEPNEKLRGAFQASLGVAKILDLPAMLGAAYSGRTMTARPAYAPAARTMTTDAEAAADETLLLTFEVAAQQYALPLATVREIVPLPSSITVVPRAEAVLLGVIAYRDSLLPVLSLRGLLGFPAAETFRGGEKVVVLPVAGVLVGLLVDRMRAIVRAGTGQIDPAPSMLAARTGGESKIAAIFRGDGGRNLVSVLAPEQLFREDVMRRLGEQSARAASRADSGAHPGDARAHATGTGSAGGGNNATGGTDGATTDAAFVVFRLGDEEFALPVSAVDEVARVPPRITRVPKTPAFLEGVINLRGEVLPVVDQRRRFDLPKFEGDGRRLIVVRSERHRAGLIVDSVSEVLRCPLAAIEPAPDLANEATGDGARLISGVVNIGQPEPGHSGSGRNGSEHTGPGRTGSGRNGSAHPESGRNGSDPDGPGRNRAEHNARMILLFDPAELLTRAERGVLDKMDLGDAPPNALPEARDP